MEQVGRRGHSRTLDIRAPIRNVRLGPGIQPAFACLPSTVESTVVQNYSQHRAVQTCYKRDKTRVDFATSVVKEEGRCFAKCGRSVNVQMSGRGRDFSSLSPSPRLTSFIRHDDDDRFRSVSLRIEDAQGHQVLRVRLQPRQRVLLQRQKQNACGKLYSDS